MPFTFKSCKGCCLSALPQFSGMRVLLLLQEELQRAVDEDNEEREAARRAEKAGFLVLNYLAS